MIRAVLDTSAVISGVFWPRSDANRLLAALALRYWHHYTTTEVFGEYERVAARGAARFPVANWQGRLAWLRQRSAWVAPAPLGKQRSRDASDDPILACAVASQANWIVSRDPDLLEMGKPFGITITTAAGFLHFLMESHRPDWPF
jgi:putative PIN family toxin of toxin-antitoxin system